MPGWSVLRRELDKLYPPSPMQMVHAQPWVERQLIGAGAMPTEWVDLEIPQPPTKPGDLRIAVWVRIASQPARLGVLGDSVTPIVSHATAERVARARGVYLGTSKIYDAAALAGRLVDFALPYGGALISNVADISAAHMTEHSNRIDRLGVLLGNGGPGLDVGALWVYGAQWVNSALLAHPAALQWGKQTAINYGKWTYQAIGANGKAPWRAASTPAIRVWQPEAPAHNLPHTDYSQKSPQYVHPVVTVRYYDGAEEVSTVEVDLAGVAAGPDWALISTQGPLPMRHPGVGGGGPGSTVPPGGQGQGQGGNGHGGAGGNGGEGVSLRRTVLPLGLSLALGASALYLGRHHA